MASSTEQLHGHIQSALQCITSSSSSPDMIKEAQDALLQYEESYADQYGLTLISLVGGSQLATLRLIAVLTLKSAIVRRWKDKGRGRVGAPKIFLSEGAKATVRQILLNLVISGKVESTIQVSYITNPNEISNQQLELLGDRQLQTNVASLLSKIARMDLPLKFQDLIPSLVEGIKSYQGIVNQLQQQQQPTSQQQMQQQQIQIFQTILYNIMNCLEAILAEISTQRLLIDKKFRISLAQQYLGTIVECALLPSLQALESFRSVQSSTELSEEYISQALQYATLTSKVVSHMMLSSFYKLIDEESPSLPLVDQILTFIHSFLSQWLSCVLDKSISSANAQQKTMKELIRVHIDLIVELHESNSIEFMRYLNPFLTLFHSTLLSIVTSNNVQSSNQFTVSCIYFLSNVVASSKYMNADAENELTAFFSPRVVQSLSATLLQLFPAHIYPNQQDDDDDDIERVYWQDDSEGFYQFELQRSSDDDVGCASQNLFLALVESSFTSKVVIPWLISLLRNVASQRLAVEIEGGISVDLPDAIISSALPLPPTNSINAAVELQLQWDAIFTAAGLVGSILENGSSGFNFSSFFEDGLGPCMSLLVESRSKQVDSLPVLHRRMIWLISCNAHQVNISSPLNPTRILADSLSSHSDLCVRLSAVEAIEALLPYCEDNSSILCSIISPSVPALYKLANECSEVESRSACLDLIANLITYIGVAGAQHALTNNMLNTIVAPLASIWDNSTDQNLLLKRNVLGILSCVASFVGPDQVGVLHPLALPLIDASFAGGEDNAFLAEEALRIWLVFLRLSKTYDPNTLGKLYPRAAELSKDLDHIVILMRITQHYMLLGGVVFLNEHATNIQSVLSNVVGKVRPRGTAYIYLVVESLLISYPIEGAMLLHQSGVLKTFIEACASNFFELDSYEPDRVVVMYMTAVARITIASPSILQTLLPYTLPNGAVFGKEQLIQMYIMKYQIAGNGAHGLLFQKLWSMLLLSFYPPCQLTSCSSLVLGNSNDIFNNFIHVLKNMKHDGTNLLSYEIHDEEEETVDIGADIYEALQQQQRTKDVVIITLFHDAVSTKINGLADQLGEGKYQEFLASINSDTLQEIQSLLS